jgi:hypothetical protein
MSGFDVDLEGGIDPLAGLSPEERAAVDRRLQWEIAEQMRQEADDAFADKWLQGKDKRAKIAAAARALVAKQKETA